MRCEAHRLVLVVPSLARLVNTSGLQTLCRRCLLLLLLLLFVVTIINMTSILPTLLFFIIPIPTAVTNFVRKVPLSEQTATFFLFLLEALASEILHLALRGSRRDRDTVRGLKNYQHYGQKYGVGDLKLTSR